MSRDYRGEPFKQVLERFVHGLEQQARYEPWQIEQARDAAILYYHHFRHSREAGVADAPCSGWNDVAPRVREWMRIKHYSPSTEKTYSQWMQRFFIWLEGQNERTPDLAAFRDFITRMWQGSLRTEQSRRWICCGRTGNRLRSKAGAMRDNPAASGYLAPCLIMTEG